MAYIAPIAPFHTAEMTLKPFMKAGALLIRLLRLSMFMFAKYNKERSREVACDKESL
jgi:hypothetical protein